MNRITQVLSRVAITVNGLAYSVYAAAQEEPTAEPAPAEVVITTGMTQEQFEGAIEAILLTLVIALAFKMILRYLR